VHGLTNVGVDARVVESVSDSLKSNVTSALRLAVMAKFGCMGGGFLLAGGALWAKSAAGTALGAAAADVLTELVGGTAAGLIGRAGEGFPEGRNGDLERSMHAAARQALQHLRPERSG